MERILPPEEQIRKFYFEKHLDFLTSVPQWRTQEIILASCVKGNSGKMTDKLRPKGFAGFVYRVAA